MIRPGGNLAGVRRALMVIAMSVDFPAKFVLLLTSGSFFQLFKISCLFFFRCKNEHVKREATLQNTATKALLLGFAMFEAELFCNYRVRLFFLFFTFMHFNTKMSYQLRAALVLVIYTLVVCVCPLVH